MSSIKKLSITGIADSLMVKTFALGFENNGIVAVLVGLVSQLCADCLLVRFELQLS